MGLIPLLFIDVSGSIYQATSFPIHGIPKARRGDYIAFDRHRLDYLNFIGKLNCEYCASANGLLAYFTEVAARNEQHWSPISMTFPGIPGGDSMSESNARLLERYR